MHLNFAFTTVQTLWALTFAALLVLLIVLLGRDRARRYPIFSFSIGLIALRLLTSRMLYGRMDPVVMSTFFLVLALVASLTMIAVAVELARKAFAGASRREWTTGTAGLLAVGGLVVALWGPWPAWSAIASPVPMVFLLHLVQVVAQRGYLFADLLAIELGIVVCIFGRRYKAGWRTHTLQIIVGLSVAALAEIAVRGIWQYIATHTIPHSQAEYEHALKIQEWLYNSNSIVYVLVLILWIVCLWREEPTEQAGIALVAAPKQASAPKIIDAQPEAATDVSKTASSETASVDEEKKDAPKSE
jgi:hypothetical protein